MEILLCEQNFRNVWIRNESVRAEIGQILRTHTRAAQLVVRIEPHVRGQGPIMHSSMSL